MSKERRPSVRATNYHEDLLASLLEEAALAGIPLIKPNLEIINVQKWLDENEKSFVPPVCNKLMHHTQLDVMFVGGPNVREDFHLEQGEELFWQLKGDMLLVIEEAGQQKEVPIREGEMFLLPGKIPHSPRRSEGSIGMVIERRRVEGNEMDGLRYYCADKKTILYQRVFFCKDLGKELGPVIEGYFASDEHKTGQPKSDSVQPLPWKLDSKTILPDPINFNQWISENAKDGQGVNVFAGLGLALGRLSDNQMQTTVFSNGEFTFGESNGIFQWIYQLDGTSDLDNNQKLKQGDSILFKTGESSKLTVHGRVLAISQTPKVFVCTKKGCTKIH